MDFKEIFKNHTTIELLQIIENPNSYQPKAIEIAEIILSERRLSDGELQIAKDEIEAQKLENFAKERKKKELKNKVVKIGSSILDDVNPIQKETPTESKIIRLISVAFGLLFMFQFYKEFEMIGFLLTNNISSWDFSIISYLIPLIILPIAIVLFYMRKQIGWILFTIYLTFSIVSIIRIFGLVLYFILENDMEFSDFPENHSIFPSISLPAYLFGLLFFTAIIWTICKENIRAVYLVNKKTMTLTIVLTALILFFELKPLF